MEGSLQNFKEGVTLSNSLLTLSVSVLVDFKCPKCSWPVQFQLYPDIKTDGSKQVIQTNLIHDLESCRKCETSFELFDEVIKIEG